MTARTGIDARCQACGRFRGSASRLCESCTAKRAAVIAERLGRLTPTREDNA